MDVAAWLALAYALAERQGGNGRPFALNAGLQAGIIGDRLFSILVTMALLMTSATAPLLHLLSTSARGPRDCGSGDSLLAARTGSPPADDPLGRVHRHE
jgi:hypothetical protein